MEVGRLLIKFCILAARMRYDSDKLHDLVIELVSNMLRKHGVDYYYVLENRTIEGESWFSYYTMTQEEADKFREDSIQIIREKLKISQAKARKEFDWFWLEWGLRVE